MPLPRDHPIRMQRVNNCEQEPLYQHQQYSQNVENFKQIRILVRHGPMRLRATFAPTAENITDGLLRRLGKGPRSGYRDSIETQEPLQWSVAKLYRCFLPVTLVTMETYTGLRMDGYNVFPPK
jgi:hypothetical protein